MLCGKACFTPAQFWREGHRHRRKLNLCPRKRARRAQTPP